MQIIYIFGNFILCFQYSIMYLEKHSLVYCWIHKAASSSWNKIFFEKTNKKVHPSNLHTAAQVFRAPKNIALPDLFARANVAFAFVRHPFERIVSAFRDKFELGKKSDWCYRMYAGDILNITNPNDKKDAKFLVESYKRVKDKPRPTFAQFIAYLLRTPVSKYNDHWIPYWLHCQFCSNRY